MTKTVKTITVILIILGIFILAACDLFNEDNNPEDTKAPIPGGDGALTISNVTTDSLTVSWLRASDDESKESDIEYLVVYSESDNISTVKDAENNGTAVGVWTKDIATLNVTGLEDNVSYYVNVLVKDEVGDTGVYTVASDTTCAKILNMIITIPDDENIHEVEVKFSIDSTVPVDDRVFSFLSWQHHSTRINHDADGDGIDDSLLIDDDGVIRRTSLLASSGGFNVTLSYSGVSQEYTLIMNYLPVGQVPCTSNGKLDSGGGTNTLFIEGLADSDTITIDSDSPISRENINPLDPLCNKLIEDSSVTVNVLH